MVVNNPNAIAFTIIGQAQSKANSRKLAEVGPKDKRRKIWIKSDAARVFEEAAMRQIPPVARRMLTCPVRVWIKMWYSTELPDLDESLVLDVLQTRYSKKIEGRPREILFRGVYINDRQVREKHIYHGVTKANPRVEICVEPIEEQLELEMTPGHLISPFDEAPAF